jgi:predicted DCC family thiol-disulfide oxidoreductase YuxK
MMPIDIARDPTESVIPPDPADERIWTVIYDPDCGFCRWSLAQVLALDRERRLRPVGLGTAEADDLLADISPAERQASWHLVSPNGRRASAGAAAPPLLRLLRGGRIPAAILSRTPRLTERSYRWVADHRSTLSRLIPARAKRHATERIERRIRSTSARGPELGRSL